MRLRLLLPCSLLVVAAIAGCGGADGDGESGDGEVAVGFGEGFTAAAERAYANGVDQEGGTTTCFVLDDEAVGRISAALGLDSSATLDESAYLIGSEGRETLQCSYETTSAGEAPPPGILVTRTDQDLDEYVDGVLTRDHQPPEQLDGDSEGLDPASVTGFALDGFQQAVWVEDGVRVQIGAREQDADVEDLFAALPVVVDEVARVLAAD